MNNFTKSIVYSGIVVAAALVAVFAIYDNMSGPQQSPLQQIEPASGAASTQGTQDGQPMSDSFEQINEAQPASDATAPATDGAAMPVDAASEAPAAAPTEGTADVAPEAGTPSSETSSTETPAATDSTSETAPEQAQ